MSLTVDGAMYAGPDSEPRKASKKDSPDTNQHIELRTCYLYMYPSDYNYFKL